MINRLIKFSCSRQQQITASRFLYSNPSSSISTTIYSTRRSFCSSTTPDNTDDSNNKENNIEEGGLSNEQHQPNQFTAAKEKYDKIFQVTQEITKEMEEEFDSESQSGGLIHDTDFSNFALQQAADFNESVAMEADSWVMDAPDYDGEPIDPDTNLPLTIDDLIIEYKDPFKSEPQYLPYFRFTQQRDGYTVESFLKKIGRGCENHVELFPTWEDLMNTNSLKLKKAQVPVRHRKWILHWVEQWKQGRNPVYISLAKSQAKRNVKAKRNA
eukprot:gene7978-9814_t